MENIKEINDIIKGRHGYTNNGTKIKRVGNVTVVGDFGYTKSIGQWMFLVNKLLPVSEINEARIWESVVDIEKEHKCLYYGIRVNDCNDKRYCNTWIVCGGATDFSGEGGHGKELAEDFLHICSLDRMVFIQPVDDLLVLFGSDEQ